MPSRPTPPRAGPPARPPVPRSPENAPGARSEPAAASAAEENVLKKDLGVNKLIAGAGAAATSAILGSFFGAMGTVTGAAVGSIASTVVTSVYEHSLNRTRTPSRRGSAARRRAAETANAAGTTAAAAGNAGSTADPGVAAGAPTSPMPMAADPSGRWPRRPADGAHPAGRRPGDRPPRRERGRNHPGRCRRYADAGRCRRRPDDPGSADLADGRPAAAVGPLDRRDRGRLPAGAAGGHRARAAEGLHAHPGPVRHLGRAGAGAGPGRGRRRDRDRPTADGHRPSRPRPRRPARRPPRRPRRTRTRRRPSRAAVGGVHPVPNADSSSSRGAHATAPAAGGPGQLTAQPAYGQVQARLQRRSGGPRVGGLGDRPHDDDPAGPGGEHLVQPGVVDPADREPRSGRLPAGHRAHQVEPGRRPARLGRGRPARADAEVVDAGLVGGRRRLVRAVRRAADHHVVRRRSGGPSPTGRSSWPRCSTSAPAASATSARSFTASSAPCRAHASASTSSAASSARASSAPSAPLSRSWTTSTPPASAASANSARSPRAVRASVQR